MARELREPNSAARDLPGRPRSRRLTRSFERAITGSLVMCALFSIFVTGMIVFVLFSQTVGFFRVHGDDTPGRANRACGGAPVSFEAAEVGISEIRTRSATDREIEYVELTGSPRVSLAGLTYVVIGGGGEEPLSSGVVTVAVDVKGPVLDASGYYIIGNQRRVYRSRVDQLEPLEIPNGDNQTHLLVRGFAGRVGDDLDTDDDGTLDATPWSDVIDQVALIEELEPSAENGKQRFYSTMVAGSSYGQTAAHAYRCAATGEWYSSTADSVAVTPWEFLTGTQWNPLLGEIKHYGVLPLICGTLLVSAIAMCITVPFGLITAIYLSEYAPRRVRAFLKPALEVLGGIPTVVYGYFALMVITPILQSLHAWISSPFRSLLPPPEKLVEHYSNSEQFAVWVCKPFESYNVMSAGIAVGIMALPIVCSLTEDALQAVPRSLREGAYGIGATKFEVSTKVVVPAALSGIVAAFLLAIARAFGETMIVALAAGNLAQLTLDPRESTQTMTAWIVQIFLGDASNFGPEYLSCYAVAATLFIMTLCLTLLGGWVLRRYREVYQ